RVICVAKDLNQHNVHNFEVEVLRRSLSDRFRMTDCSAVWLASEFASREKVGLAAAPAAVIQLVFRHLAAQGVAVNPQDFGGTGLVAVGALEHALDETLLKLAYSLVKQDSALHHLHHKPFQLISHVRTLR